MSSKRITVAVLALFCVFARAARARDVYVVDVNALGIRLPNECSSVMWDADTVILNRGTKDAVVTLLGVSNGSQRPGMPATITVPAGQATSIRQEVGLAWRPDSLDPMWLYHLDVPEDVIVESELFPMVTSQTCGPRPVTVSQKLGKVQLPIFQQLIAARVPQIVTGLTLGDLESHINIAVFNAAQVPATVIVEIRRACDALLIERATFDVASNTVRQITNFAGSVSAAACPLPRVQSLGPNGLNQLAFAAITVDQPSLSYGSIVVNTQPPTSAVQVIGGH